MNAVGLVKVCDVQKTHKCFNQTNQIHFFFFVMVPVGWFDMLNYEMLTNDKVKFTY